MDWRLIFGLSGFILTMIGAFTIVRWDTIVDFIISQELPLRPNSMTFRFWKDPEMPITLNVYYFNWTNPEQIFDTDFKPNLVEVGPYSFSEYFTKVNITWNKNSTISYLRKRFWYFDEKNSNGRLEDNITTLNPVALTAAYVTRNSNYWMKLSLSSAMKISQQKISITRTAGDFFFFCYSDALLSLATTIPLFTTESPIKLDKFAWFYKRNGSETYENTFNMDTGADDVNKVGRMRQWKQKDRTNAYRAECGIINGSDGMLFGPNLTREKPIKIFTAELCRNLKAHYMEDREVMGIPGYHYIGRRSMLDSEDPDNWCFCDGQCVPHGAINISNCQFGTPAFVSYPHFLYAHPSYLEKVQGLQPNETKHRFEMTIEPTLGIPLEGKGRLQMNLLLQPYKDIALYNDVPKIFFPMIWCENIAIIHKEYADLLKLFLTLKHIGPYLATGLLLLGLSVMIIAFLLWKSNKKSEENISSGKKRYLWFKRIKSLIFQKNQKSVNAEEQAMTSLTSRKKHLLVNSEEHNLLKIKESTIRMK